MPQTIYHGNVLLTQSFMSLDHPFGVTVFNPLFLCSTINHCMEKSTFIGLKKSLKMFGFNTLRGNIKILLS